MTYVVSLKRSRVYYRALCKYCVLLDVNVNVNV